jgi:cyclopropane-fatty-acyl-phospholipid synthase
MSLVADRNHSSSTVREHPFHFGVPLRRAIRQGDLTIVDALELHTGSRQPGATLRSTIRLHKHLASWTLLHNTELRFGEAYMDGAITIEEGTLRDLVEFAALNSLGGGLVPWHRGTDWFFSLRRKLRQHNPIKRARANAAHHYDLSDELYDLFLGVHRQYSYAYFRHPGEALKTAQLDKMRHLTAKLLIEPGMRVLDIGSGWGGMALHMAREGRKSPA